MPPASSAAGASHDLLLRMHVLPGVLCGHEKHMPQLRRRTGEKAATEAVVLAITCCFEMATFCLPSQKPKQFPLINPGKQPNASSIQQTLIA